MVPIVERRSAHARNTSRYQTRNGDVATSNCKVSMKRLIMQRKRACWNSKGGNSDREDSKHAKSVPWGPGKKKHKSEILTDKVPITFITNLSAELSPGSSLEEAS